MERRKLLLGGTVLGLGVANATVLILRNNRQETLPIQVSPPHPFRLPSHASSMPSTPYREICCVAFSRIGCRLAAGSNDQLFVWDAPTEHCRYTLDVPGRRGFTSIGFCGENSWLATISPSKAVRFWTLGMTSETGCAIFKEITYNTFASLPTCVAFRPLLKDSVYHSSSLAAVALCDYSIRILKYDPHKRQLPMETLALRRGHPRAVEIPGLFEEIAVLKGHNRQVNALSFSQDGKLLASASDDHTIQIWDASTWQQVSTLRGHAGGVTSVSFSTNGDHLASASKDRGIILWDRRTMAQSGVLRGHADTVLNAVFCGESDWLASASFDRRIMLWPLKKKFGRAFPIAENPGSFAAIDVSVDGRYLASSWGERIRFWKTSEIQSQAERALGFA